VLRLWTISLPNCEKQYKNRFESSSRLIENFLKVSDVSGALHSREKSLGA
jgi:hypothetical protein